MRNAALLLLLVALSFAATAQRFTLLPQVGFENTKTTMQYNGGSSFAPIGVQFSPHASLRLNYASKLGHGFFVGIASSQSAVSFNFTDPETGRNNFTATASDMQVRLEGGYRFNSKPLVLGKGKQKSSSSSKSTSTSGSSSKKQSTTKSTKSHCGSSAQRNGCHRSYSYYSSSSRGSCCSNKSKQQTVKTKTPNTSWVRIQPSIGMGYIPWTNASVATKTQSGQPSYQYTAGNWNTSFIAGTSFEFGKNKTRLFTVSVNYFKGLGNLGTETLTTDNGVKAVTTTFKSASAGWDLKVGIPFSLGSKKPTVKKITEKPKGCGQQRIIYRCGNKSI
jgi:hypothetical protein